jgi:CrcB protein
VSETPPPELPLDPDTAFEAPSVVEAIEPVEQSARRWDIALVVAAGGALGGGARYLLNVAWPTGTGHFPWATFVENVVGCFLLGSLMVLLLDVWPPTRYGRPFLGVGVLGGFTTFSTYTAETDALLRRGQVPMALTYFFGSLAVGLLATWIGLNLTRTLAGVRRRESTW